MDVNVVRINRKGFISLLEAREILPVIRRITEEYKDKVESIMSRLEVVSLDNYQLIDELEEQVNLYLADWNKKISRLGGNPKGLWLVDFDCGDGYYCWKYPEEDILYWHAYSEGIMGRIAIKDKLAIDNCFANSPMA